MTNGPGAMVPVRAVPGARSGAVGAACAGCGCRVSRRDVAVPGVPCVCRLAGDRLETVVQRRRPRDGMPAGEAAPAALGLRGKDESTSDGGAMIEGDQQPVAEPLDVAAIGAGRNEVHPRTRGTRGTRTTWVTRARPPVRDDTVGRVRPVPRSARAGTSGHRAHPRYRWRVSGASRGVVGPLRLSARRRSRS